LEHRPAEGETKCVFESDLEQTAEAQFAREHSTGEDTDARDTMHSRSQGLAPTHDDVLLVQSR
jgi:hypothetical protein